MRGREEVDVMLGTTKKLRRLALLLGGVALSVLYGIATLALGCWSMSDIDLFRTLHERFGRGRLRVLGRVLDWAARRAEAAA